jgi:glycosyltransferase involved in cell wall biosynthesis
MLCGMVRPRVLLLAEAANPEWVSVPLVGWSLAAALREVAEVHLVTQVRNRDAICRAGWVEGRDFTAIDTEALARPAWRLAQVLRLGEGRGWTMVQAVQSLTYPWFERLVWRRFAAELRAGRFDLVHRITPLSPTAPSPVAARLAAIGLPFVLGPLNGGVPWPPGFAAARRREREWLSPLRAAYRLLPGRAATLGAAAILAGSRHTAAEIPARHRDRVIWLPENAIDPARFAPPAAAAPAGPLRAAFIGRLVPYKGADMLIEAAAPLLAAGRLGLDIVGDGPAMAALRAQAAPFGAAVRFHGWVAHAAVPAAVAGARLFAFPSIREFGGGAVLEAMALGLVPLVVDYGGPGELVTPETGYAVPIGPRAAIVAAFRDRLAALAHDPAPLGRLAAAGQARVAAHFTWARKAEQLADVYDWVLGRRADRPVPIPAPVPI